MIRYRALLQRVNAFSQSSVWEYRLLKSATDSQALLAQADQFDIKNEDLFNQFEAFISSYRELVSSLTFEVKNLDPEAFENAVQLIDTIKKRYERILHNHYLDKNREGNYEEDFDPGIFTQFLEQVAQDAEDKVKAVAGEDIDISDMTAAQYANEFNSDRNIDRGDPNVRWTGNKVHQMAENRRQWYQNLMVLKKLNINHPSYQAYVASRHRWYVEMMQDPERRARYQEKARLGYHQREKAMQEKKTKLEQALLTSDLSGDKREEVEATLQKIDHILGRRKDYEKNKADRIKSHFMYLDPSQRENKARRKAADLKGMVIRLSQTIATQKIVLKQHKAEEIKNKLKEMEGTVFRDQVQQIADAKNKNDSKLVSETIKQLDRDLNKYIKSNPELQQIINNHMMEYQYDELAKIFYDFRDGIKNLIGDTAFEAEKLSPQLIALIRGRIGEGLALINNYQHVSLPGTKLITITKAIQDIVNALKEKINDIEQ